MKVLLFYVLNKSPVYSGKGFTKKKKNALYKSNEKLAKIVNINFF